ncbi:uncharacterized protein LOC134612367 isoform X2 [Pelobates fuscus]|uniref:uncharacterized protein LOC134612367 isoform X2 n=1 Tax=Pelobates fuscus TaxID=191477 RepID=UPI002FE49100
MIKSLKKVTFSQEPVYCSTSRSVNNNIHSGILQYYHPVMVKHLPLTSALYRKLKENGILTNEQIGLLELEESQHGKVFKLIQVLRKADHHVFTTFCAVLHETGHHQLAQILQEATRHNRQQLPLVPSISQPKQTLHEIIAPHHESNQTVKGENIQLRRHYQSLRKAYTKKLEDLEEQISLAKWKRELVIKEKDIIWSENEALQNLNIELQALIDKLQETRLQPKHRHDLGLSKDFTYKNSRAFHPATKVGHIYR